MKSELMQLRMLNRVLRKQIEDLTQERCRARDSVDRMEMELEAARMEIERLKSLYDSEKS